MAQGIRRPHEAVDFAAIERMYPPPPEYFETAYYEDRDTIERKQLARLIDKAWRTYQVPFHRNRWDAGGFHPSDIQTLDDLWKCPFYTIDDIRQSIDDHPPFGDYQGITPERSLLEPMRVYMSGGTTGKSRPTFYTMWDRIAGASFTARALYQLGIRPGDTVLNSWLYGTHNGAWCFDEALWYWLNCTVLTTSTGTVTSTERQVKLAIEYGATSILTTGDYLLRLADVAREMGYDPAKDLKIRALPNIGDPELLTQTFGPDYYRSYGFHEVQWVSSECPMHDGLHIYEDGFIVQIVDVETGEPLPDGQLGSLCVTELYKTGSPQFRYNIMDLSYLYPKGQCACGSWLRKMGPFAGRGDNMVKLRGVNVWPEGIGSIACDVPGTLPDYFVIARRNGARDEMIISVVSDRDPAQFDSIKDEIERRLKAQIGVVIFAEVVGPGAIDHLTEIHTSPKSKRFRDDRSISR
ncbi:MAG: phenylacetate--CoA ligase [Actinobacteria bacterium]|nr:MAG: phenylacetate--CoA ligase [Actinomycetota bacterium]